MEGAKKKDEDMRDLLTVLNTLDHLFLQKGNESQQVKVKPKPTVAERPNLPTATSSTWKPGKLTEVFRRPQFAHLLQEEAEDWNYNLPDKEEGGATSVPTVTRPDPSTNGKGTAKPSSTAVITGQTKAGLNSFNFSRRRFSPPRVLPPKPDVVHKPIPVNSSLFSYTSSNNTASGNKSNSLFSTCGTSNPIQIGSNANKLHVPVNPGIPWQKPDQRTLIIKNELHEVVKPPEQRSESFKTALEILALSDKAKGIKRALPPPGSTTTHVSGLKKTPRLDNDSDAKSEKKPEGVSENPEVYELMQDERMKNIEAKMVEAILNEVVEVGASTSWEDIAGLEGVKAIIKEIIIWPMERPDIFVGLRGPPKGILLFGPPGTGKTMIGRLIATQCKSTFFNISASSLTSKWIGDGEKMVRALFQVARVKQPAVIFIDEIDSILTQRSDTEHESSRRLKTEFLVQFDGCGTKSEDKILVIGVTNRPQELDEAARRRLVKRIYIPLPDVEGRKQLVRNLVNGQNVSLEEVDFEKIAEMSAGYSGADMASLCKEAAYGPIRDIGHDIQNIQADKVRPMLVKDFETALKHVKASVASNDLGLYEDWDKQFGCHI